ncbi:MAG: hypothetical protein ABL867_11675, partial [Rickettsiales bacterium]
TGFIVTLVVYPGGVFWINCIKEACSSFFLPALAPAAIILVILFIMQKFKKATNNQQQKL